MSELTGEVSRWVKLTQFTPGRQIFAVDETTAKIEDDAERAVLEAPLAAAKAAGEAQLEADANWMKNKGIQPTRPEAPKIDAPADRCISDIQTGLAKGAALTPAPGDDPSDDEVQEEAKIRAGAQALLDDHFIEGAVTITAQRYEEQLARMKRLHEALKRPENAYLIDALGLRIHVRRLGRILPAYRRALTRVGARAVSFDEVVQIRKVSYEAICQVVATILNLPNPAARARLLGPIHYQQGLMAKARAERASLKDVNPETGREIDAQVLEVPMESTSASMG